MKRIRHIILTADKFVGRIANKPVFWFVFLMVCLAAAWRNAYTASYGWAAYNMIVAAFHFFMLRLVSRIDRNP